MCFCRLDPVLRCVHAALVQKTQFAAELEFLFVPYSVFTVERVVWKAPPFLWTDPIEIHLLAAPDNQLCSEELPLAPWA